MIKVMTIVGTRPEIIKLSRVIAELDRHTRHVLVHTGQNFDYELNEIFFSELEIRKPDYFLNTPADTTARTIGNIIASSDEVIAKEKPDAVLLYGDTNSCLSVLSAKKRKVPVFHMEAGNRCFDQRVPEEINRKVVDHLSDVNLPLTEHARRYLLAEGLRPELVIKTGSCMKEVLGYYKSRIDSSDVMSRLKLTAKEFFVVSAHREENVDSDETLSKLLESVNALAETYDKRIIFSTHPRTRKRLDSAPGLKVSEKVEFMKPLGLFDYVKLQQNAFCVVSDSGTIAEESSLLGFPAVTLREAHERPEGMDEGTLVMSGLAPDRLLSAVQLVTGQREAGFVPKAVGDYDIDCVSAKVVRIILSYTDYVRRVVWRES